MIELNGLTKQFPNGKGIFDVSFTISEGEVFGFLGPNGAGKSTTIRMLMGFMKPDQGTATINGLDCWTNAADIQKSVGYLPGEIAFIEGMNGREFLHLMAEMRGLKDRSYEKELIERLQFDVTVPIRKMSKGMKQKVAITAAFMHRPSVIILDEPTSGLDPLMQQVFIDLVLEEKKRGATFLFSSHSFQEIERTCDRAAIIKDGYIVSSKQVSEWQSYQQKIVEVTVEDQLQTEHLVSAFNGEAIGPNRVRVTVKGNFDQLIQELSQCRVKSLDVHAQKLEDVFMNFYDRKGDER
ncbi:ABC-2 type transport system ATP-binding protein [Bacillus ectoiniformans]|uniref:ABC transporter ATP-binding protein n=1 Tax=Bacillus ectoiniformans TaxID=1494429 RepID=UPI00195E0000|nr:ABC transporter ATP-binding protein [Bacillus ectoiniformans]MBM7647878.1 ABC-2 type transport system ATP-binding protein [Bacillus ectoiniformans]